MSSTSHEVVSGKAASSIQIDATKNASGKVTITPRDEDRFGLTVEEVVEACERSRGDRLARDKFRYLLQRLGGWAIEMGPAIRDAYLTRRNGNLCFLVIKAEPVYSREFEDALSELDLAITRDAEAFPFDLEFLSLPSAPDEALRAFLGSSTLQFERP